MGDDSKALDLGAQHGRTVIDLTKPPLLSVLLVRTSEKSYLLSVLSHHIISDEWSAQIMVRDVLEFYLARIEKRTPALPQLVTSMEEAARSERQAGTTDDSPKLAYWRSKLAGVPRFDLPQDLPRPASRSHVGNVIPFRISAGAYGKLTALAHKHRATPFMALAAAFKILWARYCHEWDICIGTNIAGRAAAGVSDVVGLFTNTVALRTDLSGDPTFEEALLAVRKTALEAYEHQLPFPMVIDALHPQRISSRNPFFDVMLVLQNVPRGLLSPPGLDIVTVPLHNGTCKFDLELALEEAGDGALTGGWEYDAELFQARTIEQFASHFLTLLESALDAPAERISKLRLISETERSTLLERWNRTDVDFGANESSVWEAFSKQVCLRGASPAVVVSGGATVTYAELHARSQAFAARLHNAGVSSGDLVGIFCDRSERYIQALLGIQACGAAFLPLDSTLPDSSLSDVLHGARIRHVATTSSLLGRLSKSIEPASGCALSKTLLDAPNESKAVIGNAAEPSDLAYVIYTSGSTGRPKGAMVGRAGMWNHLHAKIRTLGLGPTSRVAQTAPACFDISIWQCLAPLLVGGSVATVTDEEVLDVKALLSRLAADGVTILEVIPSYLDLALGFLYGRSQSLPKLEFLVSTGDRLPVETCRHWLKRFPEVPIINAYGPTECSDDVLQYVIDRPPPSDAATIPVGHALPNTRVFVLDDHREPVPVGAVGEICVGGICVGLGYLNDPVRTAESFVPSPFTGQPGSTLYRTGDLARRRHDGAIEYLGRKDAQVKVHGVRIEVEEVEAVLRCCAGVSEAAVTLDERGDSLIAFAVRAAAGPDIDERSLREHTQERLPRFVLPSRFLVVNAIPKTSSGKVDRRGLQRLIPPMETHPKAPAQGHSPHAGSFAALHEAWCCVLDRAAVPSDADFFEAGGDSLKVIRAALFAQRAGIDITPNDIHAHPTLQGLASFCDARSAAGPAHDGSRHEEQG